MRVRGSNVRVSVLQAPKYVFGLLGLAVIATISDAWFRGADGRRLEEARSAMQMQANTITQRAGAERNALLDLYANNGGDFVPVTGLSGATGCVMFYSEKEDRRVAYKEGTLFGQKTSDGSIILAVQPPSSYAPPIQGSSKKTATKGKDDQCLDQIKPHTFSANLLNQKLTEGKNAK